MITKYSNLVTLLQSYYTKKILDNLDILIILPYPYILIQVYGNSMHQEEHSQVIGSLLNLSNGTWPDINFAIQGYINKLSTLVKFISI